jgi:hypothetical protein
VQYDFFCWNSRHITLPICYRREATKILVFPARFKFTSQSEYIYAGFTIIAGQLITVIVAFRRVHVYVGIRGHQLFFHKNKHGLVETYFENHLDMKTLTFDSSAVDIGFLFLLSPAFSFVHPACVVGSKWTEEKTQLLRNSVAHYGGRRWKKVALTVRQRPTECRNEWHRLQQQPQRTSGWSLDEDSKLKELVGWYGACKWSVIASYLNGRNAKKCRERYI